jgi:hypothetical protein
MLLHNIYQYIAAWHYLAFVSLRQCRTSCTSSIPYALYVSRTSWGFLGLWDASAALLACTLSSISLSLQ